MSHVKIQCLSQIFNIDLCLGPVAPITFKRIWIFVRICSLIITFSDIYVFMNSYQMYNTWDSSRKIHYNQVCGNRIVWMRKALNSLTRTLYERRWKEIRSRWESRIRWDGISFEFSLARWLLLDQLGRPKPSVRVLSSVFYARYADFAGSKFSIVVEISIDCVHEVKDLI